MASKYLQKYPVPTGFQEILADFTREVLRDQPPNIIEYAAKYFEMLEKGDKLEFNSKHNVRKEDKKYELAYNPKNAEDITKKATSIVAKVGNQKAGAGAVKPSAPAKAGAKSRNVPTHVMNELNRIFDEIDSNRNGYVDSSEIRKTVSILAKQYGIPEQEIDESEIREFIQVLDTNKDGKVSRDEFTNFILDLLAPIFQGIGSMPGSEKTVNQEEVENYMNSRGESALEEQLMEKFDEIFKEIDVDRSGFITSNQIHRMAQIFSAETGGEIDENELQDFVEAVDSNKDGKISKNELFDFFMSLFTGA